MTTVDKPPVVDAGVDPELTGIRPLGYTNKLPTASDWFYFDGRLRVPACVRIDKVEYSATPGGPANRRADESRLADAPRTGFEVIEVAMLDDYMDLITFTLRADGFFQIDAQDVEAKKKMTVAVVLTDGHRREVSVDVEVLSTTLRDGTARSQRPWVAVPSPVTKGHRNQNACFGYVTRDGKIPGDKFTIDLVNIREGEETTSNHADHVYYQFVHQDGTASRLTPQPVRQAVGGHRYFRVDDPGQPWTMPTVDLHASGDVPGYYRLLVWPQATDGPGGPTSALSWDHTKQEDAFQIASVYYRYHAQGSGTSAHDGHKETDKTKIDDQKKDSGAADEHALAIFQVTDLIPRVQTDGKDQWPQYLCVAMTSADEQPVKVDRLVVEAHAPTGLVFTGEAGYAYFDRLENWRSVEPKGVIGKRENNNRTLTFTVPLSLYTGDKDRPFLGFGLHVVADKNAKPGTYDDGLVTFGKHHKPVHVTGAVVAP